MVSTHRVGLHGDRTDIVKIIRDHDKRIGALARTRQLPGSIIRGGALGVGDDGSISFADRELTNARPQDVLGLTLTAGVADNYVFIDAAWSYTQGAVDYDVELELAGEGVVRVMRSSDEHIKIEPVEGEKTYTVRVYARSALGRLSLMPAEDTVVTPEAPAGGGSSGPSVAPGAPQAVRVGAGTSTVTIAWDEPITGDAASSYDVDFGEDDTFATAESVEVGGRVVSFAAAPDTEYHYRVRAKNAVGTSTWVIGSATTPALPAGRNFTTNPIQSTEVADNAISTPKLQANAVDSVKINVDELFASDAVIGKITSDSAIIASLDAAKLTVGFMDGDRIAVNTLDGDRILANTITVDRLESSTLTSRTITLGSGGVFRAGRTTGPFHYLLLTENGITFRRDGTAAYTGGQTVLNLDTATGAAEMNNVVISSVGSSRSVQVADGVVEIIRGSTVVGRLAGEYYDPDGLGDGWPTFNLETPGPGGWDGPFMRFLAAEQTIDIGSINGVSISGELRLMAGRIENNFGQFVDIHQGVDGDTTYDNLVLGKNTVGRNAPLNYDTAQIEFLHEELVPGGGSSVTGFGMRFRIPTSFGEVAGFTFQGGQIVAPSILLNSGGVRASALVEVDSTSWKDHFRSVRSGNYADWTVGAVGRAEIHYNNALMIHTSPDGTDVKGPLTVDGSPVSGGAENYGSMQRRRSFTQSIPNASWTGISWNQTPFSDTGWSGLSTGISPPVSGRFLVVVNINVGWSMTVGERTALRLTKNGVGQDEDRRDDFPSISGWSITLATVVRCFNTDRIDAEVYQNAGGSRTLNSGATLTMTYLGPY